MAGESPDRSKQRESSARKTSGSASPVPEARSEAADPRLAVARDAEKSSARGGAGTATRVLSARTAEDPKNTGRAAGDSEREDDADRGAASAADAEAAAGSDSGTESAAGDAGRAAGDSGAEDAADDAAGDTGRSGSGSDADNATDDADRRRAERDEVAQDAADDAAEPQADRSAKGGSTGTAGADEESGDGASKPADPRASGDAEAGSKAPAAKTAPKAAAPETAGAENDAAEAKAPAEGPKSSEPDKADGSTDDDAPAERPVDQPTAVFKTLRPPVDQPTTMLKLGGAAKDLPKKDLPKTDAPTTDVPKKDLPKTDAPTTDVPKKDLPKTHAPTTDVPKKDLPKTHAPTTDVPKKDAPKKDVPEKDAERTSKFVALKHLDDPATRKPVAPAEATAPVPTVGPERTTQQPLPPKPPLDLLAELTNTPPPPETPLRTAARRVKIWTPLVLLLIVVLAVVQSVRPLPSPTLELTAEDSYTFEGGKVDIPWPADGQAALDVQGIGTFGSSGEQKPVPIASVAKVMTAYVILRDHPLKSGEDGPKILIDQAAQDQSDAGQESTVDVTKGDKITEREALESILIASANNVARLLARWDAGSEKAFVRKMNQAALDLGMKNTTYTDPSGLNNTTVSTAVDQVKLAKAAMLQPAFREVAAMMSYVDYKGKKHDNWNRLVGYNNVTGIKTGTTTSALGNLVFAAKKDVNGETHRIIGAVVRQPAGGPDNTILGAALHEGDKLIRAAQGALESATILKKGDVVGYADDGLGGRTPVVVTEDVTAVGWAGLSVKLTFAADDLPHTAKAGKTVGTLTVGDGTTSAVKVPVALQKDLVEPGFTAKLTRLG
ncbi:D-alanyl-D-alanine carboxypeptidase [Streptomyces massasporeus]|uniref:D-alanyl-D-alanine carboxypeptidase n=1 Tax=Streptomyces massasporeus TaxID=67324 RepID=UPI00378FF85E